MAEQQLLVIMVPAEIKDDMVDALISCEGISGFNMETIAGYSKEHSQYNLREQVEGYREFFEFEVMHSREQESSLLATLRPVCESAPIRYWIIPVLSQGHL